MRFIIEKTKIINKCELFTNVNKYIDTKLITNVNYLSLQMYSLIAHYLFTDVTNFEKS